MDDLSELKTFHQTHGKFNNELEYEDEYDDTYDSNANVVTDTFASDMDFKYIYDLT